MNLKPDAEARPESFGWLMVAVFAFVAVYPIVKHEPLRLWAVGVAGGMAVITLLAPQTLRPLSRAWMALGLLIGMIMVPLVFGLIYFIVLTPISFAMRAFGGDPLRRRRDPKVTSYWIVRESGHSDMHQQF